MCVGGRMRVFGCGMWFLSLCFFVVVFVFVAALGIMGRKREVLNLDLEEKGGVEMDDERGLVSSETGL